jgi:DNA modification methylase
MKGRVEYVDDGLRMPKSVVFCHNLHQSKESLGHPTQKPEAVIRPLVMYSSNPGDLVLDPFCGAGTTPKVAKDAGRRWLGIEMTEEWFLKSSGRLQQPIVAIAMPGGGKGSGGLFDEQ